MLQLRDYSVQSVCHLFDSFLNYGQSYRVENVLDMMNRFLEDFGMAYPSSLASASTNSRKSGTAHLPSEVDEASPTTTPCWRRTHRAMLAGDEKAAMNIREEANRLAVKLNGGSPSSAPPFSANVVEPDKPQMHLTQLLTNLSQRYRLCLPTLKNPHLFLPGRSVLITGIVFMV